MRVRRGGKFEIWSIFFLFSFLSMLPNIGLGYHEWWSTKKLYDSPCQIKPSTLCCVQKIEYPTNGFPSYFPATEAKTSTRWAKNIIFTVTAPVAWQSNIQGAYSRVINEITLHGTTCSAEFLSQQYIVLTKLFSCLLTSSAKRIIHRTKTVSRQQNENKRNNNKRAMGMA